MSTLHPTAPLRHRKPVLRKGWRPGAWTCWLAIAWLALLAVPLTALFVRDDGAMSAGASEPAPKPWMPIYPSIM